MKLRCSTILKAALSLVLAVLLLAGTTVSGFSAIVDELAATGDTVSGGTTLYFKPDSTWKEADSFAGAAYFFDDSYPQNTSWTLVDGVVPNDPNTLSLTVPSSPVSTWTHVIFVRRSPNNVATGWDGNWGQTINIDLDSSNNLYTLSGKGNVGEASGKWYGSWSSYTPSAASSVALTHDAGSTSINAGISVTFGHTTTSVLDESALSYTYNVDGTPIDSDSYTFEVGGKAKKRKQITDVPNGYVVKDDIEYPSTGIIPLWYFGLMY